MSQENLVIVTAQPEFLDAALDELKRMNKNLKTLELLALGIALCAVPDSTSLMRRAASEHPIFLRHLAPVQTIVDLTGTENDISQLALAIANLPTFSLLERGQRFAVQTRLIQPEAGQTHDLKHRLTNEKSQPGEGIGTPFMASTRGGTGQRHDLKRPYTSGTLNKALAWAIAEETGAIESIKKPQIIVSVLCTPEKGYIGISTTEENLSNWPGGARQYAQTPEQISRAEFKLLEALETFGVTLPKGGHALDLGAAPGGWTRLLVNAGMHVVAVDPAKLDPRLAGLPNLQHYHGYAQAYLEEAIKKHRRFDVIANDMRMDAREAARLLVQATKCLRPDGFIISTFKLPRATREIDPLKTLNEALNILRKHFAIVQAHQLFHNRQEVTVIAAQPLFTRT